MNLPRHHEPYTDSYFLRAKHILEAEKLNPFVRAQVFIRKGPGLIYGISEALAIVNAYSDLTKHGGNVYALRDGMKYSPSETIFVLEGRIQDIITLETMMLGVISAQTTKANDKASIDYKEVTKHMARIVKAVGNRQILYFGARHWRFDEDATIAKAAFEGGAKAASTEIGALTYGKKGVGTIPHSLQCAFAWKYGYDRTVVESIRAFDRWIDPSIPRIALVDFRNKEVDDALLSARSLGKRLYGVRVDTCGENYMQGVYARKNDLPYWSSPGVSIRGVLSLRKALDTAGFQNVKIVLSSGFADIQKVHAFQEAEKKLGIQLFDSLGVGELFPSRSATMDIVAVGSDISNLKPIAKAGRMYQPNSKLRRV